MAIYAEDPEPSPETMPQKIARHAEEIKSIVLAKNAGYSKSQGFTTVRAFSRADTVDRIESRLDDKLSRYVSLGPTQENVDDLIGYLLLLRIEREADNWKERPRG